MFAKLNHLRRAAAVLLAAALAAVLLCGCAGRLRLYGAAGGLPDVPGYGGGTVQPTPTPAITPTPIQPDRTSAYGSAGLIAFPSVLVSVYLDENGGRAWSDDALAQSRANLAVAINWITAQCEPYHVEPKIRYDDGSDPDLCVQLDYNGTFLGGEDSDEGDDFYTAVDTLCAQLDTQALEQKYATSSIGFLVFLPLKGSSHTMVHYAGSGSEYYYEYSVLYQYDMYSDGEVFDSPAVYAHEILHLYGAADLYRGSPDAYVTDDLADYVTQNWPAEIMQDTYSADGAIHYDAIDRVLCPVTAYRLGLCSDFAGLENFPALAATTAGVFEDTAPADPWQDAQGGVAARPAA